MSTGSAAMAAAYIQLTGRDQVSKCWGVGMAASIERAGLLALVSASNRLRALQAQSAG